MSTPYTREDFVRETGEEPVQDDLERANCKLAGQIGHVGCGICSHKRPVFTCEECFAKATLGGYTHAEHDARTPTGPIDEGLMPTGSVPASRHSRTQMDAAYYLSSAIRERLSVITDHISTHMSYQNMVGMKVWPPRYIPHLEKLRQMMALVENLESMVVDHGSFRFPSEEEYYTWRGTGWGVNQKVEADKASDLLRQEA